MRKYRLAIAITLGCWCAAARAQNAVAADYPLFPIQLGWIYHASLISFTPPRLDKACILLNSRKGSQAITAFQAELEQHPEDLAAYVGMAQAQPDWRPQQIEKLEKALGEHSDDAATKFKLATTLFYEWAGQSRAHLIPDHANYLARAVPLAIDAWKADHDPLKGLMLAEIVSLAIVSPASAKEPAGVRLPLLMDEILKSLAGPKAFSLFTKAKRREWIDPPPAIDLTPETNRRALRGVLMTFWSQFSSIDSHGVMRNGKMVFIPDPVPPAGPRGAHYFDVWIKALRDYK
jgi:hypothetical protein